MPLSLRDAKAIADNLRDIAEASGKFPLIEVIKALRVAHAEGERIGRESAEQSDLAAALAEAHVRIDELRGVIKYLTLRDH